MASHIRNPLIIIIVTIIVAVIVISSLGGLETPTPEGLIISSVILEKDEIKMGENTTLTVEVENTAATSKVFELQIMYTNKDFIFYNNLTGELLTNIQMDTLNYTIIHPTKGALDKKTTIPISVQGPPPKGSKETFVIWLLVYSVEGTTKTVSDKKSVDLTVTYN